MPFCCMSTSIRKPHPCLPKSVSRFESVPLLCLWLAKAVCNVYDPETFTRTCRSMVVKRKLREHLNVIPSQNCHLSSLGYLTSMVIAL